MTKNLIVFTGLISLLGLSTACGNVTDSNLNASVNQSIEQKYASTFDLSRELSPNLADNLNATKSSVDSVEIGAKVSAAFKFGTNVIFDIGGGMDFADIFERKVLHEVVVGREKDSNGEGDGRGVFIDQDTVAANRFVNCKTQKVITDNSKFNANVGGGMSFMGLELSSRVGTGVKMEASTDYTMNRGYYKTKTDTKLARIFELCADIAKSDVALQNINHINEVVKLNFNQGEDLENLAKKVAEGKKVNDFKFHNMKYDFQISKREAGKLTFTIFPDTHWADPKIESYVKYHNDGSRIVIEEVTQECKSNCQNYHDETNKHGIKSYGDKATKEQSERYIKLISSIFAATALNSK
ncbi:MAG: hypothetical protein EOP07_05805 [Proteobacteria bacterium]|nr:MAG: hypothetical protein EOP07_05805 [Pseudomonadota bacterium]